MADSPLWSCVYGEKVALEMELIERVLQNTAEQLSLALHEGDFDVFCRYRQSKIAEHRLKDADEEFESVRLLNMLYEGCLRSLKDAAQACALSESMRIKRFIRKGEKIITHLMDTLEPQPESSISQNLEQTYKTILSKLQGALQSHSETEVMCAYEALHQIYLAFLEIEIQRDSVVYLKSKEFSEEKSSDQNQIIH